jgi:arylsulfatase A-like enzyme
LYETGIKVPLIVKRPNQQQSERRDDLISLIDVPATIASIGNVAHRLSTQSVAHNLVTNDDNDRRQYIVSEFFGHGATVSCKYFVANQTHLHTVS